LEKLFLTNNKLDTFPSMIGKLGALEILNLAQNEINFFKASKFGDLKALWALNLDENEITVLPREIGNLKALKYLNLKDNKLKWLPFEIGKLKLNMLDLRGNQLHKGCNEKMDSSQFTKFIEGPDIKKTGHIALI